MILPIYAYGMPVLRKKAEDITPEYEGLSTLLQGTPEDVYQQARYAIEAGVNIIGPECAIPLSTPLENLKAIGIDAVMTSIDNAQMESRTRPPSYDFDIITGNARSDYIPGSDMKQYYGSETADVSSFNVMGLKSPGVDRLVDVVMAADSNEKLKVATDGVIAAAGASAANPGIPEGAERKSDV